jgi:hypothetical protein
MCKHGINEAYCALCNGLVGDLGYTCEEGESDYDATKEMKLAADRYNRGMKL